MSIEIPSGVAASGDHNPPPQNHQLLALLGLFVGTILLIVWVAGWVANGLVWLIPISVEQQLGNQIVPIYEAEAAPSATQDTLNDLLNRMEVALQAQRSFRQNQSDRDYQVLYIPDPIVNAAAIPGDRIIIYQGLLDEMTSENELMMILGHELGHFQNRDHLRGMSRQIILPLALSVFLGDVGSIGAIATSSTSIIANTQFSQQQEYRADEVGLKLLTQTYGHAAGATDFFETLMKKPKLNLVIVSSHPPSRRRVQRLERLIEKQGYRIGERSPLPETLQSSLPISFQTKYCSFKNMS